MKLSGAALLRIIWGVLYIFRVLVEGARAVLAWPRPRRSAPGPAGNVLVAFLSLISLKKLIGDKPFSVKNWREK